MSIVYDLLVENKIRNNIQTVKKEYNSLLRESKQDLAVFKNEFQKLNETTNVDDSDLRMRFKRIKETLGTAKALINEAESSGSLKEKQENIRKAYKTIKEGRKLRVDLMENFSNTVSKAEAIFESIN